MLRHVQKSSLFPARINVAFPPPSQGIEDVAPQLQIQQKLFGKGGLLLGCPLPDTLTLPGHFFLPRILREQHLRRNQTHIQTHVLWPELHPSPHIWALQPYSLHPNKQGAGSCQRQSLICQFSAALTSLCFKAWPGKVGRTKHLMQVSVHNSQHPGLPWGRGKTDSSSSGRLLKG